ncbi:MAG: DsbA family protein [Anaerolineae bacterium]
MPASRRVIQRLAILATLSLASLGTGSCQIRSAHVDAPTLAPEQIAAPATPPVAAEAGAADATGKPTTGTGATSVAYSLKDDPPLPPSGVLDGIPVGFTRQGHPYRGAPQAPLTVEEFSDYHCPFCARFAQQVQPTLLKDYAATGKVRFVFREYPIVSLHPNAARVSAAALCAGAQGAEAYWTLHDALFAQQGASTGAVDIDIFLGGLAASVGLDRPAFDSCLAADDALVRRVQAAVDAGRALGFNGTPSFMITAADPPASYAFIGAQPVARYRAWFDALLAGDAPPVDPTAAPPKLPFWASPEGLAPDPERPGSTQAGDAFAGQSDAPLTVVEFTDFQCPPCRDYALEAHPQVAEAMIDSGKVRWVVKHRPLAEHPQSAVAAAAAECATAQGRFWPMYSALFQAVDRWSVAAPEEALTAVALKAGLDETAFRSCLAGREAMGAVLADVLQGGDIAPTTPTFLVLEGGRGSILRGERTAEDLIAVLSGWRSNGSE